ncbi:MAG TPA: hypothetical protein VGB26_08920 [Nitrospiria bacterium]|jgi:virginiamycin B lyase
MKKQFIFLSLGLLFLVFSLGCGNGGESNSVIQGAGSPVNSSTSVCMTGSPFIKECSIPADENGNFVSPYGLAKDETKNLLWFSADISSHEESPDMLGVFDPINEIFPNCQTAKDACRIIFPTASNQSQNQQIPPDPKSVQPRGLIFDPFTRKNWVSGFGTGVIEQVGFRNASEFPIPTLDSGPLGITLDSKGKVWFTESLKDKIGRLDPAVANTGVGVGIDEFQICQGPSGIDVDSQDNVWFSCSTSNQIGKLDSSNDFFPTFYLIPTTTSYPAGVAIDSQDRIWFTEEDGNKIGLFDPSKNIGKQFSEFILPNGGSPRGITVDPDTNVVWFTEYRGNRIGRLDPQASSPGTTDGFTEFQIPTLNSGPTSILIDQDKVVWFSETTAQKIGKLTTP